MHIANPAAGTASTLVFPPTVEVPQVLELNMDVVTHPGGRAATAHVANPLVAGETVYVLLEPLPQAEVVKTAVTTEPDGIATSEHCVVAALARLTPQPRTRNP